MTLRSGIIPRAASRHNQLNVPAVSGAAAGAPIIRNKALVFGTLEFNDDRDQPSVVNSLPPSSPELSGRLLALSGKQLINPFEGTPFRELSASLRQRGGRAYSCEE